MRTHQYIEAVESPFPISMSPFKIAGLPRRFLSCRWDELRKTGDEERRFKKHCKMFLFPRPVATQIIF